MALVEKIWKDKAKEQINPWAFSEVAQEWAQRISQEGGGKEGHKNKNSQIRKYYDVIFNLNQRSKQGGGNWNFILAQLHRQLALVHYARGRDLVTDSFVKMMEELIKAVSEDAKRGPRDLETVAQFLEAFMAYYRECRPKD
ncbi:type III-A CRISPR-associated protein Csm2 [Thermosulfurimonas marina]|uniref:CRISPR system Cms protein Csm2 n=1 Tax=Thermosulfurimonas marina TaxID=2047767 RepID=A0A6H1WUG6_9BACT|nr:type III-A CRISPR-associated protein Csm2 [Thermosulfurimonas marina]QJA06828.1 type III-A CRISPR-associated protein Csm2 [Thermosulfurimonas marina]